jgi:SAM-dependent methyltransferase
MHQLKNVTDCYNLTAAEYTDSLYGELEKKPFDRMILKRFAEENAGRGKIADLGCACGHTTRFLSDLGMHDLVGIDLSPEFIKIAAARNENIDFEVGNMLELAKEDEAFGAILAFYAIVHFNYEELNQAFAEIYRVLKDTGQFLFAFHAGDERIELDEFFSKKVKITFYYFDVDKVLDALKNAGFKIIDAVVRYPYDNAEHPSKRAYILAEK